jgi:hypothetical protein
MDILGNTGISNKKINKGSEVFSMVKRFFVIMAALFIFIAVLSSGGQSGAKYDWKVEKQKGGCVVYTSKVPGKDYIAAKCTCVVPARMETIGMVLRDIANFPAWMQDCSSTKVLKVVSEQNDSFIFWFQQHVPLLTDRDMVLKSTVVLNYAKGWSFIGANSTNEVAYNSGKGYVRMPSFTSEWLLEWIDRENTRATFMIDPDLSKGLPVGMANSTITDIPYKSIQGMMKMVKQQKYIDAANTSKYKKMIEDAIKSGQLKVKK